MPKSSFSMAFNLNDQIMENDTNSNNLPCFLCSQESRKKIDRNICRDLRSTKTASVVNEFSLRHLSRFLRLFEDYEDDPFPLKNKLHEFANFSVVPVCENCSKLTKEFTHLYNVLEETRVKLEWCVQRMHIVMAKATEWDQLESEPEEKDDSANLMATLKTKIIDKMKVPTPLQHPRVRLRKAKLPSSSPLTFHQTETGPEDIQLSDHGNIIQAEPLEEENGSENIIRNLESNIIKYMKVLSPRQSRAKMQSSPIAHHHHQTEIRPTDIQSSKHTDAGHENPPTTPATSNMTNQVDIQSSNLAKAGPEKPPTTPVTSQPTDQVDNQSRDLENVVLESRPTATFTYPRTELANTQSIDLTNTELESPFEMEAPLKTTTSNVKCSFCRAQFPEKFAWILRQHVFRYHCEDYFKYERLKSVTDSEYKKILAELLFKDLINENGSCSFCDKKFQGQRKGPPNDLKLQLHLVNEHHPELRKKLMAIQKDPDLADTLSKCNPHGRVCRCGVYLHDLSVKICHDKYHCKLVEDKQPNSSAKDCLNPGDKEAETSSTADEQQHRKILPVEECIPEIVKSNLQKNKLSPTSMPPSPGHSHAEASSTSNEYLHLKSSALQECIPDPEAVKSKPRIRKISQSNIFPTLDECQGKASSSCANEHLHTEIPLEQECNPDPGIDESKQNKTEAGQVETSSSTANEQQLQKTLPVKECNPDFGTAKSKHQERKISPANKLSALCDCQWETSNTANEKLHLKMSPAAQECIQDPATAIFSAKQFPNPEGRQVETSSAVGEQHHVEIPSALECIPDSAITKSKQIFPANKFSNPAEKQAETSSFANKQQNLEILSVQKYIPKILKAKLKKRKIPSGNERIPDSGNVKSKIKKIKFFPRKKLPYPRKRNGKTSSTASRQQHLETLPVPNCIPRSQVLKSKRKKRKISPVMNNLQSSGKSKSDTSSATNEQQHEKIVEPKFKKRMFSPAKKLPFPEKRQAQTSSTANEHLHRKMPPVQECIPDPETATSEQNKSGITPALKLPNPEEREADALSTANEQLHATTPSVNECIPDPLIAESKVNKTKVSAKVWFPNPGEHRAETLSTADERQLKTFLGKSKIKKRMVSLAKTLLTQGKRRGAETTESMLKKGMVSPANKLSNPGEIQAGTSCTTNKQQHVKIHSVQEFVQDDGIAKPKSKNRKIYPPKKLFNTGKSQTEASSTANEPLHLHFPQVPPVQECIRDSETAKSKHKKMKVSQTIPLPNPGESHAETSSANIQQHLQIAPVIKHIREPRVAKVKPKKRNSSSGNRPEHKEENQAETSSASNKPQNIKNSSVKKCILDPGSAKSKMLAKIFYIPNPGERKAETSWTSNEQQHLKIPPEQKSILVPERAKSKLKKRKVSPSKKLPRLDECQWKASSIANKSKQLQLNIPSVNDFTPDSAIGKLKLKKRKILPANKPLNPGEHQVETSSSANEQRHLEITPLQECIPDPGTAKSKQRKGKVSPANQLTNPSESQAETSSTGNAGEHLEIPPVKEIISDPNTTKSKLNQSKYHPSYKTNFTPIFPGSGNVLCNLCRKIINAKAMLWHSLYKCVPVQGLPLERNITGSNEDDLISCEYCIVEFPRRREDTDEHKLLFANHLVRFHPEHFFLDLRDTTFTKDQFQRIVHKILFPAFLKENNPRHTCFLCKRKFNHYASNNTTRLNYYLKKHLTEHHRTKLRLKLREILNDRKLMLKLKRFDKVGMSCPCGMYLPQGSMLSKKYHEKYQCKLASAPRLTNPNSPKPTTTISLPKNYLRCSYCNAKFSVGSTSTEKCGSERNLRLHMVQYHLNHFFPNQKLDFITDSEYQKILAELLFKDLVDEKTTSCLFCKKIFKAKNVQQKVLSMKLHMIKAHITELLDRVESIQKDPNIKEILSKCNPWRRDCLSCGLYLTDTKRLRMHERLYCLKKRRNSNEFEHSKKSEGETFGESSKSISGNVVGDSEALLPEREQLKDSWKRKRILAESCGSEKSSEVITFYGYVDSEGRPIETEDILGYTEPNNLEQEVGAGASGGSEDTSSSSIGPPVEEDDRLEYFGYDKSKAGESMEDFSRLADCVRLSISIEDSLQQPEGDDESVEDISHIAKDCESRPIEVQETLEYSKANEDEPVHAAAGFSGENSRSEGFPTEMEESSEPGVSTVVYVDKDGEGLPMAVKDRLERWDSYEPNPNVCERGKQSKDIFANAVNDGELRLEYAIANELEVEAGASRETVEIIVYVNGARENLPQQMEDIQVHSKVNELNASVNVDSTKDSSGDVNGNSEGVSIQEEYRLEHSKSKEPNIQMDENGKRSEKIPHDSESPPIEGKDMVEHSRTIEPEKEECASGESSEGISICVDKVTENLSMDMENRSNEPEQEEGTSCETCENLDAQIDKDCEGPPQAEVEDRLQNLTAHGGLGVSESCESSQDISITVDKVIGPKDIPIEVDDVILENSKFNESGPKNDAIEASSKYICIYNDKGCQGVPMEMEDILDLSKANDPEPEASEICGPMSDSIEMKCEDLPIDMEDKLKNSKSSEQEISLNDDCDALPMELDNSENRVQFSDASDQEMVCGLVHSKPCEPETSVGERTGESLEVLMFNTNSTELPMPLDENTAQFSDDNSEADSDVIYLEEFEFCSNSVNIKTEPEDSPTEDFDLEQEMLRFE